MRRCMLMAADELRPHSLDELIWHMPGIVKETDSAWVRGFALSILRFSKRRGWKPSEKQMAMMRQLVRDRSAQADGWGDDVVLVEDD